MSVHAREHTQDRHASSLPTQNNANESWDGDRKKYIATQSHDTIKVPGPQRSLQDVRALHAAAFALDDEVGAPHGLQKMKTHA